MVGGELLQNNKNDGKPAEPRKACRSPKTFMGELVQLSPFAH